MADASLNPASTNVIIYGHNMKNDTMFSVLLEYQDKEWYEQHKRITFNTIYGDATYEVAAVILSKAFNKGEEGFRYYGLVDAADQAEFDDYMANIRRMQLYDTGVEVSYGDSLITLSTCEYSPGKWQNCSNCQKSGIEQRIKKSIKRTG